MAEVTGEARSAASIPLSVWIVEGWFGDTEWYEPYAYLHKDEAQAACDELWATRNSENGPPHVRGLHKFAIAEVPIIG